MLFWLHHTVLKLLQSRSIKNEQCLVYMLLLKVMVCSHLSIVLLLVKKSIFRNKITRILGDLHHHLTLDKTGSHSFMHSFPSIDKVIIAWIKLIDQLGSSDRLIEWNQLSDAAQIRNFYSHIRMWKFLSQFP